MKTETHKRNAHIGLAAAAMLLIGCLSILFVADRAAANRQNPQAPVGTPSNPSVSVVTPKL